MHISRCVADRVGVFGLVDDRSKGLGIKMGVLHWKRDFLGTIRACVCVCECEKERSASIIQTSLSSKHFWEVRGFLKTNRFKDL